MQDISSKLRPRLCAYDLVKGRLPIPARLEWGSLRQETGWGSTPRIVTSLTLLEEPNVLHNTGRTKFIMKDGEHYGGKQEECSSSSLENKLYWERERGRERERMIRQLPYTTRLQATVYEDPTWRILREWISRSISTSIYLKIDLPQEYVQWKCSLY